MTRYSKERKLKRKSRSNLVAARELVEDLLRGDYIKGSMDQAQTDRFTGTTFRCGAKNCT